MVQILMLATKKKRAPQATEQHISTEEIREAIEKSRHFDAIGGFGMEYDGEEYTIRLSRRVRGRVTYERDRRNCHRATQPVLVEADA